jgi:hypothetical protein
MTPQTPAERLAAIRRTRGHDYSPEAVEACEDCGPLSLCRYHSLLSELLTPAPPAPALDARAIAEQETLADDCRFFAESARRQGTPWGQGYADILRKAAACLDGLTAARAEQDREIARLKELLRPVWIHARTSPICGACLQRADEPHLPDCELEAIEAQVRAALTPEPAHDQA